MLSPEEYLKARQYMDKRFYNEWLNKVIEKFPRGSLVTYAVNPYTPDRKTAPFFFIVDFHQEMRAMAQWDPLISEPRSVGMRPGEREGIYSFVAPSQLRHLNEEEKKLVFLHHPKIEERILQAQGNAPSGDAPANDSYAG